MFFEEDTQMANRYDHEKKTLKIINHLGDAIQNHIKYHLTTVTRTIYQKD